MDRFFRLSYGKIENFDEAISCQSPEIATHLSVAHNDDRIKNKISK
ncbi:hypothetical protein RFEPED_1140 [Rickettsia felis str. Pedreira]|uniref:Uncharacterized protein n=1 Tax=Rickettsia felis str. Pedreira TaxID=1359196 RepID=A0A0F3MSI4_RICFI|nr:hypothetical protein RFEPED_1140 [Rickettsia felis str. Pedreira]